MNILEFTLLILLCSFFAEFLGSLTGLGGGVVIVPLLAIAFGVDVRYAIGASLVSVIATSSGAAAAYVSAKDPSAVIIASAVDPHNTSKLCAATIDIFVSIFASEAANLALKVFATGCVYLAGGIPLHALRSLHTPRFMESFKRKGRLSELMERIPIYVILVRAAVIGAAAYGLESFKDESA